MGLFSKLGGFSISGGFGSGVSGFATSGVFTSEGVGFWTSRMWFSSVNRVKLRGSKGGIGSSGSGMSSLWLVLSTVFGALLLWMLIGVLAFILAIIPACVRFPNGLGFLLWPLVLLGMELPGFGVLWLVVGVLTTGLRVSCVVGLSDWLLFCSGWRGCCSLSELVLLFWEGFCSSAVSVWWEELSSSDVVLGEVEGSVKSVCWEQSDSLGTQVLSLKSV